MKPIGRWGWGGRNWALLAIGVDLLRVVATPLLAFVAARVEPSLSRRLGEVVAALDRGRLVFTVVVAVAFLAWLSKAYDRALFVRSTAALERRSTFLGIRFVHWFFVPLANLVVPYFAIATLDAELEPGAMPLPPRRRGVDRPRGYRDGIPWKEFLPRAVPRAPVGAFWAVFAMRGPVLFLSPESTAGYLVWCVFDGASLVLALVVVWRISARLAEVARRAKALARAASEAEDAGAPLRS